MCAHRHLLAALNLFLLFLPAIGSASDCDDPTATRASSRQGTTFVALLTRPECYEGRVVQTIGYLGLEPGLAIYLSRSDAQDGVVLNGIALDVDIPAARLRSLHGAAVLVEGSFESRDEYVSLFATRISSVLRLLKWSGGADDDANLIQ